MEDGYLFHVKHRMQATGGGVTGGHFTARGGADPDRHSGSMEGGAAIRGEPGVNRADWTTSRPVPPMSPSRADHPVRSITSPTNGLSR